jgi:UDP-N-acetylmuramate: L-alanyl-gamma-D-glutamyl-meso-diaminopimelate ligase
MTKSDIAIVYIDERTFIQKKLEPFTQYDVQTAFNSKEILFFNNSALLEDYLLNTNFYRTNLLLMSSGNFGGLDLTKLARELNTISSKEQ